MTKLERIVEARMKLRRRFQERMNRSPGVADPSPLGSGRPNRHGMPKLPPGQVESKKWPVLDLGISPDVDAKSWRLTVDGACSAPLQLRFSELLELPQTDDISDFHCVTTWSRMDIRWRGVTFADLAAAAEPHESAEFVLCHAYDGYTTNLPLSEALKPDVMLVHRADDEPLAFEHGGPVRLITPQLYAWKGAKWLKRIEFLEHDTLGFWEQRGYSNSAHPWRDDRYS